jgi:hypothetical protein
MTVQGEPSSSIYTAQNLVVDGDGRRYTNIYETTNETSHCPVICGERQVQRSDLPLLRRGVR